MNGKICRHFLCHFAAVGAVRHVGVLHRRINLPLLGPKVSDHVDTVTGKIVDMIVDKRRVAIGVNTNVDIFWMVKICVR